MARHARMSRSSDLLSRITDTITSHSRLSAAAAFQMGVLLGQVMNNTGAMKGIRRRMAAAPEAVASSIPTFGLFEGKSDTPQRRVRRRAAKRRGGSSLKRSRPAAAKAAQGRKRTRRHA